nr:hypothetical protein [Halomonas sp.]
MALSQLPGKAAHADRVKAKQHHNAVVSSDTRGLLEREVGIG